MSAAIPAVEPRPRRWATPDEAAAYARCHVTTIRNLLNSGDLTRYKLGAAVRVDLDELDSHLIGSAK